MRGRREIWIIAVALSCLLGSMILLSSSRADRAGRVSGVKPSSAAAAGAAPLKAGNAGSKITLQVGELQRIGFVNASDLAEPVASLSSDSKPVIIDQGDINQDGQIDLFGAYVGSNGSELRLRLGDIAGEIGLPQVYALEGLHASGIAMGDLTNDGLPDIAVSTLQGKLVLFAGSEDNRLHPAGQVNLGGRLGAITVAEIDHDGIDDLLVVDTESNTVKMLVGNGDLPNAQVKVFAPQISAITSVAVADFDNDFWTDIAIAGSNAVVVLYGNEARGYERETRLSFYGEARNIVVKDFNGDHYPDLALASSNGLAIWHTRLSKGFSKAKTYLVGRALSAVSVGDYNRDGQFDLSVIEQGRRHILVLLNVGNGFGKAMQMEVTSEPLTIASGNFRRHGTDGIAIGKADGGLVMAIAPQVVVIDVSTVNDENDCPTCTTTQLQALTPPGGGTGISLREAITAINNDFLLQNRTNQGIGFQNLSTVVSAVNPIADVLSTCGVPTQTYWFLLVQNSPLPPILAPGASIEGDRVAAPTAGGPTNTLGPKVFVSGGNLITGGFVITSSAPGVIIKELGIRSFLGNAITVQGNSAQILNNVIGYDCDTLTTGVPAGITGNTGVGIILSGTSNSRVAGNFVGANGDDGIQVNGISLAIPVPQNNVIENNTVGLNRLGNRNGANNAGNINGNTDDGIHLRSGAVGNRVRNNVVGANGGIGIRVSDNITADNIITGNKVGIDPSGQSERGNGQDGIAISDVGNSKFNQVSQNLVSGNGVDEADPGDPTNNPFVANGIRLSSADTQAQFNIINNNKIGVNAAGSVQVPNIGNGILITGLASNNTVGGSQRAAFNQISGNNGRGVYIGGGAASPATRPNNNVIRFNDIGPNNLLTGAPFDPANPSDPQPRSNKGGGMVIDGASFSNIIAQNNIAFNNDSQLITPPIPNDFFLVPLPFCSGITHVSGNGGAGVQPQFNTITRNNIFLNPPQRVAGTPTPHIWITPPTGVANGAEGMRNTQIAPPVSLTSLIEINSVVTVNTTGQTTIKGTINYLNNGITANINQSTIEIFVSRRGQEYTGGGIPAAQAAQALAEGQLYLDAVVSFQPNPINPNTLDWSASVVIPAQFLNPSNTPTVYVTATTTTGDGSTSPFSIAKVPQFVSGVGNCSLTVNPNPISFTNAPVGAVTQQTVTLTNSGTSILVISSLTINQSGTQFSVAPTNPNTLPITLNPGQAATITVSFTPTNNNTVTAQLVIGESCNGQTFVPISGQGCQPTIQVNPTAVNFGTVQVGNTATATVQVSNTGCSTLVFTAALSNNTPSAFSITNVTSGTPANVNLAFTPLAPGTFNGTLIISSTNASNSPVNVPLTGQATQPQQPNLVIIPANVIFGDVPVGTTATQAVTIRNAGNALLTLSTPVVQTGANLGFGLIPPPTLSIPPNEFTTMQVSFTPVQTGQANGSILVSSNAGSQTIVLSGNGVAARIAVAPGSVDFGTIPVGQPAQPRTLTVSNLGTGPLEVRSLTISGGTANGFSIPNSAPFTVQPGSSGAISVAFTPNRVGPVTDSLIITSNDPSSPTVTVTLAGAGGDNIPPTVSVQAPTAGQAVGSGQQFTVRFTANDNIGLTTFEIRLSTNGGGSFDNTIGSGNAVSGANSFTAVAPVGVNTSQAVVQVLVRDTSNNVGTGTSPAFAIVPPPNIFGPSLVNGKFSCVASGSNIQPGAVLVVGNDTFAMSANKSGSKFLVKRSTVGSGGRTLKQLVPTGTTVQVVVRNPNGVSSSPASVTAR